MNTISSFPYYLLGLLGTDPLAFTVIILVMAAGVIDFITHRISNLLTVGGFLIALSLQLSFYGWDGLTNGLVGFFVAFIIYFPLYVLGWMGAGDVKLMAAVGGFIGWPDTLLVVGLSTAAGSITAIAILIVRGGFVEYISRYGSMLHCLLSTGQFAYVAPKEGSAAMTRFPYAFAITLGTLATLAWLGRLTPFYNFFAH
jgi:prepilin peptidase CpaA